MYLILKGVSCYNNPGRNPIATFSMNFDVNGFEIVFRIDVHNYPALLHRSSFTGDI